MVFAWLGKISGFSYKLRAIYTIRCKPERNPTAFEIAYEQR
jgi:hypothetical protein